MLHSVFLLSFPQQVFPWVRHKWRWVPVIRLVIVSTLKISPILPVAPSASLVGKIVVSVFIRPFCSVVLIALVIVLVERLCQPVWHSKRVHEASEKKQVAQVRTRIQLCNSERVGWGLKWHNIDKVSGSPVAARMGPHGWVCYLVKCVLIFIL